MESMQHEKSAHNTEKCNMKIQQYEKSVHWKQRSMKSVQYRKSVNLKQVQHEKNATSKK